MTDEEWAALIADESKSITGNIQWEADEDHSPGVEFRVEIESDAGYPLFAKGSYNRLAQTLSYVLIYRGVGRIYALDLGRDHHNPTCTHTGDKRKHTWSAQFRDKDAYVPADITTDAGNPVLAWNQFCLEAKIKHDGTLSLPPPVQRTFL